MIKVALLIVLLAGAWWMLSTLEQRSLYFPDPQVVATPAIYQLTYDEVRLKTSDGAEIHSWFIPNPNKKARTLLFSHGNAGNISHRLDKALKFHQLGLNVMLFDYRGYGKSPGKPSEQGTYQDADAAYRYLTETRKIPPSDIILYGESLGCAVAVEMAVRHPAAALILESPFTSTVAMGKRVFPWLPISLIVRYRYDNLSKVSKLGLPLLIMHSPEDEIVPFSMGKQLYEAAAGPKTLFELSGGHNDGYEVTGRPYVEAIVKFLHGVGERR